MQLIRKILEHYKKVRKMLGVLGSIFFLLVIASMIGYNMGFPKDIDERLDACIFTEDGRIISCQVTLKGEVTRYPLQKEAYPEDGELIAYVGDQPIASFSYGKSDLEFTWQRDSNSTRFLRRDRSLILVGRDLQRIFPEEAAMHSILVAPVMDKAQVAALLDTLPQELAGEAVFAWLDK